MATLPTTYGEKVDAANAVAGRGTGLSRYPRHVARQPRGTPAGSRATVRRRGRRRPHGLREDDNLFTCLGLLNTPDRQLPTIEDPVEYRVEGLDQVEVNPRAGLTFANGLRTILRSDPDVLLVGEIREEERAQIAFGAAMTGHLILTTLHAQTAAAAIQRLTDMNIERSILATSINCIVASGSHAGCASACCVPGEPDPELLQSLGIEDDARGGALRACRRFAANAADRLSRPDRPSSK